MSWRNCEGEEPLQYLVAPVNVVPVKSSEKRREHRESGLVSTGMLPYRNRRLLRYLQESYYERMSPVGSTISGSNFQYRFRSESDQLLIYPTNKMKTFSVQET